MPTLFETVITAASLTAAATVIAVVIILIWRDICAWIEDHTC